MVRETITRRRLAAALGTTVAGGLAGCGTALEDGEESGRLQGGVGLERGGELTIRLVNEVGEFVGSGVEVTVESEDSTTAKGDESNDGGEIVVETRSPGEHTVTAASEDGEFEPVRETVTVDEGEPVTVTLVLEGAEGTATGEEADAGGDEADEPDGGAGGAGDSETDGDGDDPGADDGNAGVEDPDDDGADDDADDPDDDPDDADDGGLVSDDGVP